MACRTVSQSTPDIRWVMTHENGNLERANVYCTGYKRVNVCCKIMTHENSYLERVNVYCTGSFKGVNVYCKQLFRGS